MILLNSLLPVQLALQPDNLLMELEHAITKAPNCKAAGTGEGVVQTEQNEERNTFLTSRTRFLLQP